MTTSASQRISHIDLIDVKLVLKLKNNTSVEFSTLLKLSKFDAKKSYCLSEKIIDVVCWLNQNINSELSLLEMSKLNDILRLPFGSDSMHLDKKIMFKVVPAEKASTISTTRMPITGSVGTI